MTAVEFIIIGFAIGIVVTTLLRIKKKSCPEKGQDPLQKHGDL